MIERLQYNAPLAITGAIKGASQQKNYNELCLLYNKTYTVAILFIYTNSFLKVIIITTHKTLFI